MKARLALAVATGTLAEVCGIGLTATAAWLIARAAEQPSIAALGLAIVGVRAFAIFRGTFRYAERLSGHDVTLRAVARLRSRIYAALVRRRANLSDGDALSRMVSDVDSVQDLLLRCALPAVVAVSVGSVALTICALVLPVTASWLLAGLLVAAVLLPAIGALVTRKLDARLAELRADLAVRSLDLVDGHQDLVAFGAVDVAVAKADAAARSLARQERLAGRLGSALVGCGVLVQGATAAAVTLTATQSGASSVVIAVVALTSLAAFEPILPLAEAAARLVELWPAFTRVRAALDLPAQQPKPHLMTAGTITLRDVRLSFGPTPALDGVSLCVEHGRSVAIVGASGAGKSTLLGVIAGLVEPDSGVVRLPETRALTQDAHLFRATIRKNLLLARPSATDDAIADAMATSHCGDHALDASIDGLSGGERQRLLLARALLADADVLLLDEPTEGLDTVMADQVLTEILATRAGRTTVLVTHRLAALSDVDDIVVLDRGRIVQRGSHTELTRRPGPYRDLWNAELMVA
ncbi:thiol reductant ABC exporter subunit CydC [Fodinicola acaciae]|uniref:thiol reductant ABC exporter subunit CydC n=1 Tax=Fodinicola acaciae TaxID=2681555 RepID=UPI0013CFBB69|nr:thiol reductant ABC exporter subunit CydC [Fodinicola acaciae]